jgi:pyruvate dehydrogenase E1 component beta subunit
LIPLGKADVKREGTDITIVTYGRSVLHSLAAAERLAKEHKISVEVVDLRSIRPLDIDTVLASVARTHRVLIVEEQKPFASVGSQLAYMIQREAFDELDGPIHRLATIDAPAIYSPPVEIEQLPNPNRVVAPCIKPSPDLRSSTLPVPDPPSRPSFSFHLVSNQLTPLSEARPWPKSSRCPNSATP